MGYYLLPKKRALVYANLKTVFCLKQSPYQLRYLTRQVFSNLTQSFIELLCFAKINSLGFKNFIHLQGKENIFQARRRGKGVILLAVHSGNWELGNIGNGLGGIPYNVVANLQPKMPQLDALLNSFRKMAGANVIARGVAAKEIIKALKRNELVGLVLDQGGKDGVSVNFMGKTATMSSGSVRLALKYGCAICPAWITRQPDHSHVLKFFPAIPLISTGDLEQDIQINMQCVVSHYEKLLLEHPEEYLWFYKVFKYTGDSQIVILDDGHTGHLAQARSTVRELTDLLNKEGKNVKETTITLDFRTSFLSKFYYLYGFLSKFSFSLRNEDCLKYFLTDACYALLMKVKADFVISCGSRLEGVNFILSKSHQAKSVRCLQLNEEYVL